MPLHMSMDELKALIIKRTLEWNTSVDGGLAFDDETLNDRAEDDIDSFIKNNPEDAKAHG